jgi:L,D-peptidoglycan transpeptidase YkuD (ErfK/YbiS/YcfS/YnhG family)
MKSRRNGPQAGAQLIVRGLAAGAQRGILACGALRFSCALGRTGRRVGKREGDGATPVGHFALREVFYRGDRLVRPRTRLPIAALDRRDGWCDDPADRNYNRRVRHPYPTSAEHLWRHDRLYDVIVVLAYNEIPRVKGHGSAIFMHVAGPGMKPTEGCIALSRDHLLRLIECAPRGATITILS